MRVLTAVGMVVGLALLAFASDWFVVGSARIATVLRVPAVVVGAVVIGLGTSAPEMLVTVLASAQGDAPLAIGNVVGSNLANLTLVLGAGALVGTVVVSSGTLRRETPISAAAVCLFALVLVLGLNRITGSVLFVGLALALVYIIRTALHSRREDELELITEVIEFEDDASPSLGREVGRALVGLAGTLLGAHLVVVTAVEVAQGLGLSEGFVGLTIVAIGTSLPELVTAVQAGRRGEADLVVGNVLGSNLFNSFAAGGLIGLVAGDVALDGGMRWSVALMVVVAVLVGVLMVWRRALGKREALVLLVAYVAIVPLLGGS